MIGATFCSGIGAPEMAAPWIDWRLASEIEPFPRSVLQERFGYRLIVSARRIDAYFNFVLHHELSHGLGPGRITVDGRETEVRLELKVEADGNPKLSILDSTGRVVHSLPPAGK